tara:strand:+ start:228 stop:557 length:330 start_codon:yes stop_codon:yes gene_type:complete
MTFYQTIDQVDSAIKESNKKTKRQEDLIYSLFVKCNQPLSPSMVLSQSGLNCPITSIRRAMSDLTNEGKLVKTNRQVKGIYGKAEHLWELPELKKPVQVSLFATPKHCY